MSNAPDGSTIALKASSMKRRYASPRTLEQWAELLPEINRSRRNAVPARLIAEGLGTTQGGLNRALKMLQDAGHKLEPSRSVSQAGVKRIDWHKMMPRVLSCMDEGLSLLEMAARLRLKPRARESGIARHTLAYQRHAWMIARNQRKAHDQTGKARSRAMLAKRR